GVFSDAVWLESKAGISGRGGRMIKALGTGDLAALTVPPDLGVPDPQQDDETRRQWLARTVAPTNCVPCHEILDPWGHALEHFDQLGQYRDTDNGQPVDASDTVMLDGQSVSFADMTELAPALARSCEVAANVSRLFLVDALTAASLLEAGEAPSAADVERVRVGFLEGGKTFRSLAVAVAQTEAVLR
ncbi:MAG TPA: DUF1588 domain-containing protein, partial [Polyangiaceae bacterium]|nr:DUF1588 domain-containing protein [Polyangiaceae bacterium]